jgi:hypothetical protein
MAKDELRLQVLNHLLKTLKVSADPTYRSLIISIDVGTTYGGYVDIFEMSSKAGIFKVTDAVT